MKKNVSIYDLWYEITKKPYPLCKTDTHETTEDYWGDEGYRDIDVIVNIIFELYAAYGMKEHYNIIKCINEYMAKNNM